MKITRYCVAILILCSTVTFVFPFDIYEMDVIQSFAFHAMLLYMVVALIFLIWRQWALSSSSFSAGILILLFLYPHLRGEENDNYQHYRGTAFTLKIAHFNVLCSNTLYQGIARQALRSRADLLSFQEIDSRWAGHLTALLKNDYPYYQFVHGNPHGVMVFSKHPLRHLKTYFWAGVPNLVGDIALPDIEIHFIATHTLSPRNAQRYQKRNEQLEKIAQYLKTVRGPVLAIGDFNAVPWDPTMVRIQEESRLLDSRSSITPTFPSNMELGGIPIDYILHSVDVKCLGFRAIEATGSDHRGIVGVYEVEEKPVNLTINTHRHLQKAEASTAGA